MSTRRPLTSDEALRLNYKQLLDRLVEETHFWEDRRRGRMSGGARAAEAAFIEVRNRFVADEFMDKAVYRWASEPDAVLAERDPDYWMTRVDGSPPRPPRRIQRSRVRGSRLPYGCRVVTRPGPYGNPANAEADGNVAIAVLLFRNFLEVRRRLPDLPQPYDYPSDIQIVRELSYWDLACWCPESTGFADRCHADVLLRVAAGGNPAPIA